MALDLDETKNRITPKLGRAILVSALLAFVTSSYAVTAADPSSAGFLHPIGLGLVLLWMLLSVAYLIFERDKGWKRGAPLILSFMFAWVLMSNRLSSAYTWTGFILKRAAMERVAMRICGAQPAPKELNGGHDFLADSERHLSAEGRVLSGQSGTGCFVYFKNFEGALGRSSGYLYIQGKPDLRYGVHQDEKLVGNWYYGETFSE